MDLKSLENMVWSFAEHGKLTVLISKGSLIDVSQRD